MAFSQEILSLEDAIRIGLENSFSIQIARNNIEIAKNNNTLGNAGLLPRIDLNINQSNNFQNWYREDSDGTTLSNSGYPTYSLTSGLQLNWTLFDGFAMFIRREKLELLQAQSDLYLRIELENKIADIVYTYFSIALNAKLYKTYNQQLALSRQRLDIAREKSKIGVGYQLQELQAEVDFRADSALLLRQRNRVANLKADLNRFLVRSPEIDFQVNTEIPVPKQVNTADIYSKVSSQNIAILNARLLTQIGELEYGEAKSSRYPDVNLFSAYNFSHTGTPESQQVVKYRTHGPTVGVGASITLFNGFDASRRIRNAQIVAENIKLNLEDIQARLQNAAFKLVNELNQALELVLVEEKSVVLAQRNADAAWERYNLGAISDLELRESQNKLLDAQSRLISAQLNAQIAEIEILTITGEMGSFLGK